MTAEPSSDVTQEGPYLVVALPARVAPELYPSNLTSYLEEWAVHLDPVAEIVDLATGGLGDWVTRGHFVEPVPAPLALVRDAARREELVHAFRGSEASLDRPELGASVGARLRSMAHGERLDSGALPVLLGLAVLCVETWPVGHVGVEIMRQAPSSREENRDGES